MQKIAHPESRTAFRFQELPEWYLGALVAQHLEDIMPEAERERVNGQQLHKDMQESLAQIVIDQTLAPTGVAFVGAEGRVLLRGFQIIAQGELLPYEQGTYKLDASDRGVRNRTALARNALAQYYNESQRDVDIIRQLKTSSFMHAVAAAEQRAIEARLTRDMPSAADMRFMAEHSAREQAELLLAV